nr:putative ribonuclease H-like domain-containing protein [Tanacetum cinerariifolium]
SRIRRIRGGYLSETKPCKWLKGIHRKRGLTMMKYLHLLQIKAIRLFLAYASFMGSTVYQMDVKSAFLYGTIDEEVYVMQPLGFQDPEFPARV